MDPRVPVLTIDGPSGAGKGTIAKAVAEKLGWHYLDSGALYRALGVAAMNDGVDLSEETELVALANKIKLEFKQIPAGEWGVFLDGKEIQQHLQTEQVGAVASKLAVFPAVRDTLKQKQRGFQHHPGLVADGRDMGSVVFTEAEYKVYLTASAEIRGKRRYKQLIEKGISANLAHVIQDIEERDSRDKNRSIAPLVIPQDALYLDTSNMAVKEVLEQVLNVVNNKT
ncbi:MAG: cytidylate kinase [Cycloclasticus sp. symbiont of Poecilosclerida sp. M]|nr:MAG: cytidylate kinase [Cycloclasticus sp. symbiont of Poecilosclerida sp. M]